MHVKNMQELTQIQFYYWAIVLMYKKKTQKNKQTTKTQGLYTFTEVNRSIPVCTAEVVIQFFFASK